MSLRAPSPAARSGWGTPRGGGLPRLFPALRSNFRACLGPGRCLSWHCESWVRRGTQACPGSHRESPIWPTAAQVSFEPLWPLSPRSVPSTANLLREPGFPVRSQSPGSCPGSCPGSSDRALCSVQTRNDLQVTSRRTQNAAGQRASAWPAPPKCELASVCPFVRPLTAVGSVIIKLFWEGRQ